MPFTFVFEGTFTDLYHLLNQVQGFTVQTAAGAVHVSGRLLTVQSASLELPSGGSETSAKVGAGAETGAKGASPKSPSAKESEQAKLKATITASAYVLPSSQGLTGGATAAGPAGAAAVPASGAPSTSSTTAPAVIKVSP
jgi:hypothetical protein